MNDALQENNQLFHIIAELIPDAVILTNSKTEIMFWNKGAERIFGYSEREILGASSHALIPRYHQPKDRKVFKKIIEQYSEKDIATHPDPFVGSMVEIRSRKKDGTEFWAEFSVSIFKKGNENIFCSVVRDLTARKTAEELLKESEERFRILAQSATDAIIFVDQDERIFFWNECAHRMFGYAAEEMLGKSARMLLEKSRQEEDKKVFSAIISSGRVPDNLNTVESICVRKDGTEFASETSFAMGMTRKGPFYCGITRDISQRKNLEQALLKLNAELEKRIRERTGELEVKTQSLEQSKIALEVLLKKRESDKKDLEESMLANIKEMIVPMLEKLKNSRLDPLQRTCVEIIASNLNEIISPFAVNLSSRYLNLTPMEIQVACLIKEGKTSKQIASLLNSSAHAVDFHRKNLRRKLGLTNKNANLRTQLLNLQH